MTVYELDAVVNTASHPKQAIALGFALGYIDAFNGFVPGDLKPELNMEPIRQGRGLGAGTGHGRGPGSPSPSARCLD